MRLRMLFTPMALVAAFGLLISCTTGCGSKVKPTGEVYGKVSYKDKPVTAGNVKFFPEAGGEPVLTLIAPDGTYRITGVPVGRSKVAVETLHLKGHMTPPPPGLAKMMNGPQAKYVEIPKKYEQPDTSTLAFEVEKGAKPWDIELQ
jgi:hypothetical protein